MAFQIENGVLKKYTEENGITDVIIPDSVTSIGRSAFYGCTLLEIIDVTTGNSKYSSIDGLLYDKSGKILIMCPNGKKSVTVLNSVTSIGDSAFEYCSSLTTITIPDSVTSIGDGAFECCSSLTTVTIPDSVTKVSGSVFKGCKSLTNVTIPDSVTSIGDSAFEYCSSLTTITIPDSVTSIGDGAFEDCKSLTTVTIPDSVTKVSGSVFKGCKSLTNVTIPDSVTSIGDGAFECCSSLTTVTIPDNVTKVSGSVFKGCKSLTNVTIPDSVTSIGDCAFEDCKSLTTVTIPDSVTKIGNCVFEGCKFKAHLILPKALVTIGRQDFYKFFDYNTTIGQVWLILTGTKSEMSNQSWSIIKSDNFNADFISFLRDRNDTLIKISYYNKIADFIAAYPSIFNDKEISEILELAKTKNAKKAVEKIVNLVGLSTKSKEKHDDRFEKLYDLFRDRDVFHDFFQYLKSSKLTEVKLKDSTEAAPDFVVICALLEYLDLFKKYTGGFGAAELSVCFCSRSDKAAEYLDMPSFAKAIDLVYQECVGTVPAWIIPYCRYGTPEMIAAIVSQIPKWDRWAIGGSRGRQRAKIAVPSVKLSKTKEAMIFYEKKKELDIYAGFHHTTADILRDTVLADFGLDDEGKITYDLGNKTITAALQDDLTFSLYDNGAQKIVKSIPKKGADPELHAKASNEFKKLKSDVKKVVKARNDLLFDYFLSGSTRYAKDWLAVYTVNPVLRKVAELIVWKQNRNTFLLTKDGAVDCHGQPYTIDENILIGVAHPIEMDKETLDAWRTYFAERKLKQPFEQIWEAAVEPSLIKKDRYKDCPLPFYYFRNREKHGIMIEDEDFHNEITIYFKGCHTYVDRLDWSRHEINNEDRFEVRDFTFSKYTRQVNHIVYLLDKWTIRQRILKDDTTIGVMLESFTLPQIMSFIDLAADNNCVNSQAVLLNYRNEHYPEYDGFAALDALLLDDDF